MNKIIMDNKMMIIANTINLHLSYLNSVSSSINILESSLQYPLLECMERRLEFKEISLEHPHPTFKQKRCDIFWKNDEGNPCIMEMKYHKKKSNSIDFILKDIIRLYFALESDYSSFFLLCTHKKDYPEPSNDIHNLDSIKNATIHQASDTTESIEPYEKWLSLNTNNKILDVNFDKKKDNVYDELIKNYIIKNDNFCFPDNISFKTRLVCNSRNINAPLTHQVTIWEILKTK